MPDLPQSPGLDDGPFIAALFDLAIPPEGDHPGAGSLDLVPALKRLLAPTPEVVQLLELGLAALRAAALARNGGGFCALDETARLDVVNAVAVEHPGLMPTLQMCLYVAYYQHPQVLRSHGLTGRPPFPEGRSIQATDESLLRKLKRR